MRFHAKFGMLGWCQVSLAVFALLLWFGEPHSRIAVVLALSFLVLALQRTVSHVLIYWEADSNSLRERRFLNTKEIQWGEVTRVGSFISSQPSSDYLQVEFVRPAAMPDGGHIIAHPEDRQQFLAVLHRFASEAHFDA